MPLMAFPFRKDLSQMSFETRGLKVALRHVRGTAPKHQTTKTPLSPSSDYLLIFSRVSKKLSAFKMVNVS